MDLMQLLENEETERARKKMHKDSFNAYKRFEFLKAGLRTPEEKQEDEMKLKYTDGGFDPYDYPPVRDSVATMFTDGIESEIRNKG